MSRISKCTVLCAAALVAATAAAASASVISVGTPADETFGPVVNASGVSIGNANPGDVPPYGYVTLPGQAALQLPHGSFPTALVYGINDAGYIVGGPFHAMLWNPADYTAAPIDLDAWLDAVDPVAGAQWTLTHAAHIDNNGIIVGEGTYLGGPANLDDGNTVFILDASSLLSSAAPSTPEPASIALAFPLLGAALTARRSRRA